MPTKTPKTATKSDPLKPRTLDWSKAVRGKYHNRYREGTNVVVLEPELMKAFPDSAAVNDALRALVAIHEQMKSVKPARKTQRKAA